MITKMPKQKKTLNRTESQFMFISMKLQAPMLGEDRALVANNA